MKVDIKPGLNFEIPNEVYHSSPGISFTGFKEFLKYPAKYKAYLDKPKESTSSQLKGSAVHMLTLEPHLFDKTYVRVSGPMNKNPGKKEADDAKEAGLIPVNPDTWEEILGMSNAIMAHPEAGALIRKSKREVSVYWNDPDFGTLMKCRPDILDLETGIIGDIKYFNTVDYESVYRQMMRMKYHIQSAWYLRGTGFALDRKLSNLVHVFVEEEAPHGVMTYAFDDASLERAELDIKAGMTRFSECEHMGVWPGPPTGVHAMSLKDWDFAYEPEVAS